LELPVDISSPVTTEICVDDDAHVGEVIFNGTARALLIDSRLAKLRDVWGSRCDARWNSTTREKPSFHIVCCPFSDVDTATVVVQWLAIIVWYRGCVEARSTARIVVLFYVTISSD
jgi:hypothetical protein